MRFEGTDRALRCVASVYVGRHKLKRALPLLADCGFKTGTGLVVEDNEVDSVPLICEALHDLIVGWDAVPVTFGGERFDEDSVGIVMIRPHDVLVAGAQANRELAHVVSVEPTDWACPNINLV